MMKSIVCLIVLTSCTQVVWAQPVDECVSVLQLTGNNITIRESKDASTAAIAQQFCDEKYQYLSTSERQSIDASFKLFAASYGSAASSVQDFRSKYCSAGQQTFTSDRSVSEYARQSYAAAVEAWKSCDQLRKDRALIVPAGDERSITYTVTNRTAYPEELTSVIPSPPDAFLCKAISATNAPTINPASRFPLLPGKPFSVSCQRLVSVDKDGTETAKASSITIVTSITQTPFFMRFPSLASPDLRVINAADLRYQLRTAVDKLNMRLIDVESRKVFTSAKPSLRTNSKPWTDTNPISPKTCGDGYVMIGFDPKGEVACATIELVP